MLPQFYSIIGPFILYMEGIRIICVLKLSIAKNGGSQGEGSTFLLNNPALSGVILGRLSGYFLEHLAEIVGITVPDSV